jgi:hypothetical protein
MPRFEFRFAIPPAHMGQRSVYEAYVTTLDRLTQLKGAAQPDNVRIQEVWSTSGSVVGMCLIDSPSYEDALRFLCQETPLLDLEWHVEEHVDSAKMSKILTDAIRRGKK